MQWNREPLYRLRLSSESGRGTSRGYFVQYFIERLEGDFIFYFGSEVPTGGIQDPFLVEIGSSVSRQFILDFFVRNEFNGVK